MIRLGVQGCVNCAITLTKPLNEQMKSKLIRDDGGGKKRDGGLRGKS